ncbi:hypothetical protein F373_gp073 [Bacillus phage SP-10]|uniref:hypothetical protein n=1 Tax=Bacillus phage SP10 TaxID=941058 RepID=UPI0002198B1D|nr:hypothetical protein F373_gp073 [Bacillus phage SP-10]BAK52885.1 hypothetical protein [Bacillus phage SP-10]
MRLKVGDVVVLGMYRHVVVDVKKENGDEYALLKLMMRLNSKSYEGKWVLQELLPPKVGAVTSLQKGN